MTPRDRLEQEVLPHVRRPQRYAGRELHRIVKPDAELRFGLAFPDLYEIGMSSLAVQILYHRVNESAAEIACERTFLPAQDAAARLRASGIPLLTLETGTPLRELDLLGVSLSYELALPGMLELLDLGGVAIRSRDRTERDPIVVAGGPVAYNPEPYAEFVDLVAVGDGEQLAVRIAHAALAAKRERIARARTIARLAALDGIYHPAAHSPERTRSGRHVIPGGNGAPLVHGELVESLPPQYYPRRPLVPLAEVTFDRLSVEIMRGCTRGCRFCQAGTLYRPVRERPVDEIVAQARANLDETGYGELSLTSLSTSDFGRLPELIDVLQEEFRGEAISLAFPSLRPDSFTTEMACAFPGSRKAGITFAPEAGTQRLRNVINKDTRDEDLLRAAALAFEHGYTSVKLYFMLGLPAETDEDLRGIAQLAGKVARLCTGKRQRVTASVGPFAPKPHTPFQRVAQNPVAELRRKQKLLRRYFNGIPARLTMHDPDSALVENAIARGDRRLAGVIERVWREGGTLEAWHDRFDAARWMQAFRDENLDPAALAAEIAPDERLPWAHISKGVPERFHEREMKKALRARITSDCRVGQCHACGLERMIPEGAIVCNLYPSQSLRAPEPAPVEEETGAPVAFARVRYTRGPELRWAGHLDVVREWERLLRRARVPVAFTHGFNPHPRLAFGPPLPLGLTSEAEYIDIALREELAAETLLERINSAATEGLRARAAIVLRQRPPSLTSAVERIVYGFSTLGDNTLHDRLSAFLQRNEVNVHRRAKDREKVVNIRPYVDDLRRENGRWVLALTVRGGTTARLDELARAWEVEDGVLTGFVRLTMQVSSEKGMQTPLAAVTGVLSRAGEAA
ncbi:MAG: Ribosomal protein S12 methylthiotransferase RimO [Calditrichaeota bacterium]|nr:Ribosomal protein S12 methylthiotransferase RimO [Calditrichota bacterium]